MSKIATAILIIGILSLYGLVLYIATSVMLKITEEEEEEKEAVETESEIYHWYKDKLKLIKRSRGLVYRGLLEGLNEHTAI